MNRYALGTALMKLLQKETTFYIVSMVLLNGEMLRSIYRYSGFFAMLQEKAEHIIGRINPKFINLEITKTATVQVGERLTSNMEKLRRAGCHFSMDDFGTGYSNLSHIGKSNFELIKLDKSLLWPCFEEGGKKAEVFPGRNYWSCWL